MMYNVGMDNLTKDFVSNESRQYKFKLGGQLASALSGFIAGVIVSSIVWYVCIFIVG
jgi:hypothetical protein